MKIWIDIVNSPHVLFFKPLIEELHERGHSVSITAREYAHTIELLEEFNIPFTLIGAHAGSHLSKKIVDVLNRGNKLYAYAKDKNFDVALTFNSPSMVFAAKVLRIPSMVFMDYEYQPLNHLTFRLCDMVVTPAVFPDEHLAKYGAVKKCVKYDGLKEHVYLSNFEPTPNFLDSLGIDKDKIIVVARPPATMALYHHFKNGVFYEVVNYLLKDKNVHIIAIPRSEEQRLTLKSMTAANLMILERAIDGRNLLYYSDIVVSAGGTMNREAAVLGVPAYTVFKGKIGAVDRYLIGLGRITPITTLEDAQQIRKEKNHRKSFLGNVNLKLELTNLIFDEVSLKNNKSRRLDDLQECKTR